MRRLILATLVVVGCGPPSAQKVEPLSVEKVVVGKIKDDRIGTSIDGWALVGGKLRSTPVSKTTYRLYAADGTYVTVPPGQFVTTGVGDAITSHHWMTDR